MTINGIWLVPFAAPFVVNLLIRAVFWFSGAGITDPSALASLSLVFGVFFGVICSIWMWLEGVRWPITLWRDRP